MANRKRTFQQMCAEVRMKDAEALFQRARVASGVAKIAFGAAGRAIAYGVKERALGAMVKLAPFLFKLKADRLVRRYRLTGPFGDIHWLKPGDVG